MRKLVAVVDQVSRCKIMDKTLADYINRIKDRERQRIAENRNVWNDPELASQDIYNVYPEKQSEDSDEKINPYGQH